MALRFGVISVDDHVVEPPDLWTRRMSRAKWGDRVPHIAEQPSGTERWVIDGQVRESTSLAATGALSRDRGLEPQTWSEVPQSAYDPHARLAAMDSDGVDYSVLYPSAAGASGEVICAVKDLDLQAECARGEASGDGVTGTPLVCQQKSASRTVRSAYSPGVSRTQEPGGSPSAFGAVRG